MAKKELADAGAAFMQALLGHDNFSRLLFIQDNYQFVSIRDCIVWMLDETTIVRESGMLDSDGVDKAIVDDTVQEFPQGLANGNTEMERSHEKFEKTTGDKTCVKHEMVSEEDNLAANHDAAIATFEKANGQSGLVENGISDACENEQAEITSVPNQTNYFPTSDYETTQREYNAVEVTGDVLNDGLANNFKTCSSSEKFVCRVCSEKFEDKPALIEHSRTHTTQGPHCSLCDKSFASEKWLLRHKKVHMNAFVCTVCQKSFRCSTTLRTHYRVHTGEKPFQCQVCLKCFSQKQTMVRHFKIHTGEKRYGCQMCHKQFHHRFEMKRHTCVPSSLTH